MTPLDKPLKRELQLGRQVYTVTIHPLGVRIVEKGRRTGHEVSWDDILNGDVKVQSELRKTLLDLGDPSQKRRSSPEDETDLTQKKTLPQE